MNSPWSAPDVRQARDMPLAKVLARDYVKEDLDYVPRDIGAGSPHCGAVQKQPEHALKDRADRVCN